MKVRIHGNSLILCPSFDTTKQVWQRFTPSIDVARFVAINRLVASDFARNKYSTERIRNVINWPNSYSNFIDHACTERLGDKNENRQDIESCASAVYERGKEFLLVGKFRKPGFMTCSCVLAQNPFFHCLINESICLRKNLFCV
jgi:hypothetical protein